MRLSFTFLLIIGLLSGLKGQGIEAYLSHCEFDIPGAKPYTEISMAITGRSIMWLDNEAAIEITLILRKDTGIVTFSKEIVQQQENDTAKQQQLNLVYQKRLMAPDGEYMLDVYLHDKNKKNDSVSKTSLPISLSLASDSSYCSSIYTVSKVRKSYHPSALSHSGLEPVPHVTDYYPPEDSSIHFYIELYPKGNLNPGDDFLFVYYIRNFENKERIENTRRFKRLKAALANPLYGSIDIKKLPTGKYELIVLVKDKQNRMLTASSYFFKRKNAETFTEEPDYALVSVEESFVQAINNYDTLSFILRAMGPISTESQRLFSENLIAGGDKLNIQKYLLYFWETRSHGNPEAAFKQYMQEVNKVEKLFSTKIHHGFETDRGRVYLQYGPPNTRMKNYNEPSAYPYEIWHYYTMGTQRNRKFVFYNTDLVSNEFYLLHSDAIGEPSDYQWRIKLRSRDSNFRSIDQTGEKDDNWGSEYNRWYNEPR